MELTFNQSKFYAAPPLAQFDAGINKHWKESPTCRSIKTLFNFELPATELEIRDASLQFVHKLTGFNIPFKANEAAFDRAVETVAASARLSMRELVTNAEPCSREVEVGKVRAASMIRFNRQTN